LSIARGIQIPIRQQKQITNKPILSEVEQNICITGMCHCCVDAGDGDKKRTGIQQTTMGLL